MSNKMDEPMTIVGTMAAGMAAMSGVVGVLWRKVEKQAERLDAQFVLTTKELIECREDRAKLHTRQEVMERQIEELQRTKGG